MRILTFNDELGHVLMYARCTAPGWIGAVSRFEVGTEMFAPDLPIPHLMHSSQQCANEPSATPVIQRSARKPAVRDN
jgi:hypothetical protein